MLRLNRNFIHQPIANKKTKARVNTKIMETWIEDTLHEAEQFEIPGVIVKPRHKNPIARYGIDRLTLARGGISDETIDRVYRSLFVYSVGFHELMKTCLEHTKNRYELITAIWKVFAILLEYCCKSDYKMLVEEIHIQNEQKLKQMEVEYNHKLEEMKEDERNLKNEMSTMQNYSIILEREKLEEKNIRLKLEEELLQNSKNHEEEVQLRLKFESKLNNMHSIHRDLGTKYRRALLDIETLQNTNELLNSKKLEILEEFNKLKAEHAEQNTKLAYDKEKINALERENKIKIDQVNDLLNKTAEMQEKYDKLQYHQQLSLKTISEQKLNIDILQSQIQTLKNEKTHLRQSDVESRMLKETFENKLRETAEELKTITETLQLSQREVLGFNEIKKEREERISKLKSEVEHLTIKLNSTETKLAKTSIILEKTSDQLDSIKEEYHSTVEKLKKINKARNDKEYRLSEEKHTSYKLRKELEQLKEIAKENVREIDDNKETIREKEKEINRARMEKESMEKRHALQINQINQKVVNISGLLLDEQQARENWADKYEKEQRMLSEANTELLKVKSQNKDLELQIKSIEIRFENMTRTSEHLQKTCEKMQEKANNYLTKFENCDRELKTKTKLITQLESQKEEILSNRASEISSLKSTYTLLIANNEMHYEDFLSRVSHLQTANNLIKSTHSECTSKISTLQNEVTDLTTQLESEKRLLEQTAARVGELSESNRKLKEIAEKEKKGREIVEQSNLRLSVDLKQKNDKLKQMYEDMNRLEQKLKGGRQLKKKIEEDDKDEEGDQERIGQDKIEEEDERDEDESRNEGVKDDNAGEDASFENSYVEKKEQIIEESKHDVKDINETNSQKDVLKQESVADESGEEYSPLTVTKKKILQRKDTEESKKSFNEILKVPKNTPLSNIETPDLPNDAHISFENESKSIKEVITSRQESPKDIQASSKSNKLPSSNHSPAQFPLSSISQDIEREEEAFLNSKIKTSEYNREETLQPKSKETKTEGVQVNLPISREITKESSKSKLMQESLKPETKQLNPSAIENSTMTDYSLLKPIIDENVHQILQEKFKSFSPIRPVISEKSLATMNQEQIDPSKPLLRDESQNTYQPHPSHTRVSIAPYYTSTSPMLTKNSIHHTSNSSTLQADLTKHIQPFPRIHNSTEEAPNTNRSDDLLNTSTELEPTSRSSMHPKKVGKHKLSLSPASVGYGQNLKFSSQQPGYIDRDEMIEELPNKEEIISNPKSREQSKHNKRQRFGTGKPENILI
jgi:golgin subfamily B member 1